MYVNYSGTGHTILGNGTGNVSINAGTNPSYKLHVGGTLGVTGNTTFAGTISANYAGGQIKITGGSLSSGIFQATASPNLFIGDWDTATKGISLNVSTGVTTFSGNVLPSTNGTLDLGSTSNRWSTIYTSDLSLNNGIGDWTIVEGEDDLFLYNNKKGKVYKFALTEVDPNVATPKIS
jgi:hypothetical protein